MSKEERKSEKLKVNTVSKKNDVELDKSLFWNPVKQPTGSKLCGHCCLATALGISLNDAIKKVGHRNGTRSKELTKYFAGSRRKLKEDKDGQPLSLCVAREKGIKKGNFHWVLQMSSIVYDPIYGCWLKKEAWEIQTNMEINVWNILIF